MNEPQPQYARWKTAKGHTKWHAISTEYKPAQTLCRHTPPDNAEVTTEPLDPWDICGQCRNRTVKAAPKGRAVNRGGGRFLAQWCPMPGHGVYSTSDGACPVDPCVTVASVSGRSEVTVSLDRNMLAKVRAESGRTGISRSRLLTIAVESHAEILTRFIATIPDA